MKARFAHLAMLVLGGATLVLSFLAMIPKYAAFAGGALLLATDAKKALAKPSETAVAHGIFTLFFGMVTLHALYGCATLSAVAKACAPATTDQTEAVTMMFNDPTITTAETIAALEGSKIAICVVSEIAKDVLDKASQVHEAATLFAAPSPLVARAQAWLEVHPQ